MSSEDTTDYRLNQIDDKLSSIDEKFSVFGEKLDNLKTDLISSRCPAPGSCVNLQLQLQTTSEALQKISYRLEAGEKRFIDMDKKIASLETWQRAAFWGIGVVGTLAVFFKEQVVHILQTIF